MTLNQEPLIPVGSKIIFQRRDERGNKVEIAESGDTVVVELKTEFEDVPLFATLRNGRMFSPPTEKIWLNEHQYYGFYSSLFPIQKACDFDIVFADEDELYLIPVRLILLKGDHSIIMNKGKINQSVYIRTDWCQTYKMY